MSDAERQLTKRINFEFELSIDDEGDDYAVIYARRTSHDGGPPNTISNIHGLGAELEIYYGTIEKAKSVFEHLGDNIDIADFCSLLDVPDSDYPQGEHE